MESKDIRPFIPAIELERSRSFYQALGFTSDSATADMIIMSNGVCTFFLYQHNKGKLDNDTMFQLVVPNIETALCSIENITVFDVKYEPIKEEPWGKVIYLWGPSGEMWHITELASNS
ncbi:MAG: lactoylglutathione lyase [Arenicella sp.]